MNIHPIRRRDPQRFRLEHLHLRVVEPLAPADRPEVPYQFELAEVTIDPDREKAIIENRAGANVEIAPIIRSVADRNK